MRLIHTVIHTQGGIHHCYTPREAYTQGGIPPPTDHGREAYTHLRTMVGGHIHHLHTQRGIPG